MCGVVGEVYICGKIGLVDEDVVNIFDCGDFVDGCDVCYGFDLDEQVDFLVGGGDVIVDCVEV